MGKPKKRTKTAEEIRQQKRDCERKRRARIKENATLYEAAKAKDKARYEEKKKKKQVKLVGEMTPREHRNQRKEWRERKLRSRLKQKRTKNLLNHLRENTPETTDDEAVLAVRPASPSVLVNLPEELVARPQSSCASDSSACSSSIRLTPTILSENSPGFSDCSTQSRQKKKGVQTSRARRALSNLIIKKQREKIQAMKQKLHTLQVKLLRATDRKIDKVRVTKKKSLLKIMANTSKPKKLRTTITKFLERDDNTKMCSGKKDCITRNKTKKQKRYLSDTLLNLHKKFLTENTFKISFATFCRLKPFWIVSRKISKRDTCLCVVHENTQLMFDKLKHLDIISNQNLRELSKTVVCDINSEACMLRKCNRCKNKVPKINNFDDSIETTYKLWTLKKENRMIQGKEKEIRRTVKTELKITKKALLLKFLEALDRFLQHQYYITHQYTATTQLKTNLSVGEIFMQVDFAENYCCKYTGEIQAVHFGASRQQVSLHTGVYYYRCPDTEELKSKSFCTFSDCLRHDAGAVFAHMQKILDIICLSHPMKTLHVLSDGPTAQYRNKKSFYLFSQYLTQRYGIQIATWNFSEAGHGKGPMDGIGAVVKRTADRVVAQGEDIPDFVTFTTSMVKNITNVTISVVTETDIKDIDRLLTEELKSIPGTLKIHQITWNATNSKRIYLRKLTCMSCESGQMCPHHSLTKGFVDFISRHILQSRTEPVSSKNENVVSELDKNENDFMESTTENKKDVPETEVNENKAVNSRPLELKDGMWIVVRFMCKKTEKQFLGQIISFDGEEPQVKFIKRQRLTKENVIFVWIEPEDIFAVSRDDIMAIITEPTPGRRGELLFSKIELKKYVNIN